MEEIQKKTRKASSTKKDDKASKTIDIKKETKNPRTSTTKKATASKTSLEKKERLETQIKNDKKDANSTKTSSRKRETTESKISNTKKDATEPKASRTKKEGIMPKTTKEKKETGTAKLNKVKQQTKTEELKKELEINKEEKIDVKPTELNTNKISSNNKNKNEKKQTKEEKKVEKDKTKEQEKTNKQKNKTIQQSGKNIDISIGAILATIIIILLVILNVKLGISAYNLIKEDNQNERENTNYNNSDEIQEIGQVLNVKDEIVGKMLEKITFSTNATASIYKTESFNKDTIPNDLKLRLGWSRIKSEDKLESIQASGKTMIAAERRIMKDSVEEIFGPRVKYDSKPFNNTDVSTFSTYAEVQGMINYDNELYMGSVTQNGAIGTAPLIYQEIQKVVEYDSGKIKVYVKTAFADVKDGKYIIYKEYKDGFSNQLLEIIPEELFKGTVPNQFTGEGTVTENLNVALNEIRNQLDTYTYTFEFEDATEEYYLAEFNKEISKED